MGVLRMFWLCRYYFSHKYEGVAPGSLYHRNGFFDLKKLSCALFEISKYLVVDKAFYQPRETSEIKKPLILGDSVFYLAFRQSELTWQRPSIEFEP